MSKVTIHFGWGHMSKKQTAHPLSPVWAQSNDQPKSWMKSLPETGVGFKLKCVTGFVTKSCTVPEIRRICTFVGFVTLRQMRPTFPGNRQIELNEDPSEWSISWRQKCNFQNDVDNSTSLDWCILLVYLGWWSCSASVRSLKTLLPHLFHSRSDPNDPKFFSFLPHCNTQTSFLPAVKIKEQASVLYRGVVWSHLQVGLCYNQNKVC